MTKHIGRIAALGVVAAALAGTFSGIAHADIQQDRVAVKNDKRQLHMDKKRYGKHSPQVASDRAALQRDQAMLKADKRRHR